MTQNDVPEDIVPEPSLCIDQRIMNDNSTKIGASFVSSFIGAFSLRNILCPLMSVYNNWTGHYATKTGDLSKRLQASKSRVEYMIKDMDDVIHTLNDDNKRADTNEADKLDDLLLLTIMEHENLRNKVKTNHGILECGNILGKSCMTDNDCVVEGCTLQCKSTGYMWWRKRLCITF
ncbi:hypothetical protein ACF0H5_003145 [Mactra antiquata]